jgi:uncharacterized membrane protein YgcG
LAGVFTIPLLAISWSGIVYETTTADNHDVAAFAALMFIAAMEALISLTSAVLCCRAVCCRKREKYARVYLQGRDAELPQYPVNADSGNGGSGPGSSLGGSSVPRRGMVTPRGSDAGIGGGGGGIKIKKTMNLKCK